MPRHMTLSVSVVCAPFWLRITARLLAGCIRPLPAPSRERDLNSTMAAVACQVPARRTASAGQSILVSLSAVTIRWAGGSPVTHKAPSTSRSLKSNAPAVQTQSECLVSMRSGGFARDISATRLASRTSRGSQSLLLGCAAHCSAHVDARQRHEPARVPGPRSPAG